MTSRVGTLFVGLLVAGCGSTTSDPVGMADGGNPVPWPTHLPSIYASLGQSCSLDSEGVLACWGDRMDTEFKPPETEFHGFAMGPEQFCGIRADSTLRCWGGSSAPIPPPGKFAEVALGAFTGCGLDLAGHALCWGTPLHVAPGVIEPPPGTLKAITGEAFHYCALRQVDGHPVCWGGKEGIEGYGEADPPDEELATISAGDSFTCGMRLDGSAICWGHPLDDVPYGPLLAVAAGPGGACFIFPDQNVSCTYVGFDAVPLIEVLPGPFAEVAVGGDHACGLRPGGSIACWGNDGFGQATPPK